VFDNVGGMFWAGFVLKVGAVQAGVGLRFGQARYFSCVFLTSQRKYKKNKLRRNDH